MDDNDVGVVDLDALDDGRCAREILVLIRAWDAVDPDGCHRWTGPDVARSMFGAELHEP